MKASSRKPPSLAKNDDDSDQPPLPLLQRAKQLLAENKKLAASSNTYSRAHNQDLQIPLTSTEGNIFEIRVADYVVVKVKPTCRKTTQPI